MKNITKILIVIGVLTLTSGILAYRICIIDEKINAYLIDNANINKLNSCTRLDACNGWQCLCNNMVSENDYCKRYEDLCVNNICKEITKNLNEVNFMDAYSSNNELSMCIFIYEKVVNIEGIKIENISNEVLFCISEHRNNMPIPKEYIQSYEYRDGKFIDNQGYVIC